MNNGGAPIRFKHRVAVYGTLKRGRNNSHILRGARFVGTDWMPKLSLYHLGPYPGAVEEPSTGVRVEIYEVKDSTLKILDELEDFFPERPQSSLYIRRTMDTRHGPAWVYLYNRPVKTIQRLNSGSW
ncbi:gamma-glutamylcyclotransferase family protein [Marinobacter salsuginis]|uniref:gamma-glutamylcyclotransferase family protein n=1 Tax=Marinobacter salsuginis TaxID=418719 RepID=UPI00273F1D27|nr:gamma-glutamylcyclotransferase family protein [Marinobacter salsuginis]